MRTPEEIWDECRANAVRPDPCTALRTMQRETIEACAKVATSFLVGDPKNGVPLYSPSPHQIADAIRSLIQKEEGRG